MTNNFLEELLEFEHKTVRVYIESSPDGFPGFLLNVNPDNIVLLSVCNERKCLFAPRTITVVPTDKITAISRFADEPNCIIPKEPNSLCTNQCNEDDPDVINIVVVFILTLVVLMNCTH